MTKDAKPAAVLYRMVMPGHLCPWGLKALWFLKSQGYAVEDHWLRTKDETEAFKAEHDVKTTPQAFIDGVRIGGYSDLRAHFGKPLPDPKAKTYAPVIAVFAAAAAMAVAASHAAYGAPFTARALQWFMSFAMVILAGLKLRNVEAFSTMFLNYDLLARRWVPYAYLYPLGEFLTGALMASGNVFKGFAVTLGLVLGGVGAASVIKAVYIDRRELKCACVGGDSNVPLGFLSLTENLMMVAMALWMAMMPG